MARLHSRFRLVKGGLSRAFKSLKLKRRPPQPSLTLRASMSSRPLTSSTHEARALGRCRISGDLPGLDCGLDIFGCGKTEFGSIEDQGGRGGGPDHGLADEVGGDDARCGLPSLGE